MLTARRILAVVAGLLLSLGAVLPHAAMASSTVTVTGTVVGTTQLTLANTSISFGSSIGPDGANGGVYDSTGNSGACYAATGPSYTIRSNTSWYGTVAYSFTSGSQYAVRWVHAAYSSPVSNSPTIGTLSTSSFTACDPGTNANPLNPSGSSGDAWLASSSSMFAATNPDTGTDNFAVTIEWTDAPGSLNLSLTYSLATV